ncbi:MAG: hypothetical protein Q9166_003225 [cf. Caloplaca sp. 2 TL-2023]
MANSKSSLLESFARSSGITITQAAILKSVDEEMKTHGPSEVHDQAAAFEDKELEVVPTDPFPFMKLPPELRCMIYKEVLVATKCLTVPRPWWADRPAHRRVYFHPEDDCDPDHSPSATCQIFRVSKAFYSEAMPVYFGENTFHFQNLNALSLILNNLSAERRRSIMSMAISFWGSHPVKSVNLLQGCVSLRRLSIGVHWGTSRFAVTPFLSLYGVRDLLKVRGIQVLKVYKEDTYRVGIWDRFSKEWEEFVEALEVLKQPYSKAALSRQDKKDYPPEKAKRTVFGRANVVTRSEKSLISSNKTDAQAIEKSTGSMSTIA